MARLSDLQIASLLEEIGYAMRAGTPVVDSMHRIETRRLGAVAKAAKTISGRLERGETVADALASVHSGISGQAAAAIRAGEKSGDFRLIERVAVRLRQRCEFARESRLAWFYPWLLLAVGYVVAVLVMAPLIRQLHGRDLRWSNWLVELAHWLQPNWWLPPVVAVVSFVIFLAWLHSRHRFPRPARLSLFCSALADQMTHDVPEDVAVGAAAEISGDPELMSIAQPSLNSPAIARMFSASDSVLETSIGVNQKQAMIARLRYLSSIHGQRARQRAYIWARLVPRTAMVIVGAGLTLAYVWWVIAPVYVQVGQW